MTGMARAIDPAHTALRRRPRLRRLHRGAAAVAEPALEELVLGHAAALCLARAIARGVHAARPAPGNLLPCWCEIGWLTAPAQPGALCPTVRDVGRFASMPVGADARQCGVTGSAFRKGCRARLRGPPARRPARQRAGSMWRDAARSSVTTRRSAGSRA